MCVCVFVCLSVSVCICGNTFQVVIELVKQPGRTLGFSIAGGRGSTPAYEDVDEVCLYNIMHSYSHSACIFWVGLPSMLGGCELGFVLSLVLKACY